MGTKLFFRTAYLLQNKLGAYLMGWIFSPELDSESDLPKPIINRLGLEYV